MLSSESMGQTLKNQTMKNLIYLSLCAMLLSSSGAFAQFCEGVDPAVECDDGDPCTLDICTLGICQHIPIDPGMACNDEDPNTVDDVYDENCNCVGTCNDDNPTTMDLYIEGVGCIFVPLPEGQSVCDTTACADLEADLANPCSQVFFYNIDGVLFCQRVRLNGPLGDIDNNACTSHGCECGEVTELGIMCDPPEPDPCHEYICDPNTGDCVQVPVNCDDFNPATYDFCHPEFGCQHVLIPDERSVCQVVDCGSLEAQEASELCTVTHTLPDGSCVKLLLTGVFDDGDVCTTNTSCICGLLLSQQLDCDDGIDCTLDECDPVTGCSHTPYWESQLENLPLPPCYELCGYQIFGTDGTLLEDALDPINCIADSIGILPTQIYNAQIDDVLECEYILELHYVLINCDDGNPCTIDFCDFETGNCVHLPIIINSPCNDGNACTINDTYNDQCECVGEPVNCDDGDPCTIDTCDQETGICLHIPMDCCDDNPYTIDSCEDGQCHHVNGWQNFVNSPPIGNCFVLCTYLVFDGNGNTIEQVFTGHPDCGGEEFTGIPIVQSIYDPCTGQFYEYTFSYTFTHKNCDDGNPCTLDECDLQTGNCTHTPRNCDDSNIYTVDSCNGTTGECEHEFIWQLEIDAINQDNLCYEVCDYTITDNTNDVFLGFFGDLFCFGDPQFLHVNLEDENGNIVNITIQYRLTPVDCDDSNPCTLDTCDPLLGCQNTLIIPGTPCDDGNLCTFDDTYDLDCNCVGIPLVCNDGNPCSADSCDPETGECLHVFPLCDDNNPCTIDGCNPETGNCEHLPLWQYTIDNTASPFCHELCGYIVTDDQGNILDDSGAPVDCEVDVIIPVASQNSDIFNIDGPCNYVVLFHYHLNHEACDDGDPCTIDTCDPITGDCVHTPKDCDDNNVYTIDSCDQETGNCVHVFVWQDDLDGLLFNNPCFTICNYLVSDVTNDLVLGWYGQGTDCGDANQTLLVNTFDEDGNALQLVIFYSTTPTNCDDGDPCTEDSCDPIVGCQHFPVFPGTECDDGDPNTINDVYHDAPECECIGVPIIPGCVQEDACNYDPFVNTDDGSCLFPGGECDDANPLTINDQFDAECNCVGEALILGCPQVEACNYDPNVDVDDGSCLFPGGPCDDGNAATENDELDEDCNCAGTPIDCEDGDPYTDDHIDPETGDCVSIHVWDLYLQDLVVPPCYELCSWVVTQGVSIFDSEILIEGCASSFTQEVLLQVIDPFDGATIDLILTLHYREKNCDDQQDCTIDTCDPISGECVHTIILGGEPCDDGDPNTTDDMYNSFCICVGTPTCKEDLNGDGSIDTSDLLQFLGSFGTECE